MEMPVVLVKINGYFRRALVDTGCTTTIVHSTVVAECRNSSSSVIAFDGSVIQCKRRGGLEITVGEVIITVDAIVVERIVKGVDIVLDLDAITQLGGVTIHNGMIKFGHVQITATACADPISELADANDACIIKDTDFLLNSMVNFGLLSGSGRIRCHQSWQIQLDCTREAWKEERRSSLKRL